MDAFPVTGNYNPFLSGWLFFLETDFVIKLFVFILFLSNDYQCGSVQSFDGSFIAITVESDFKFVSGNAPGEVFRIGSASWYIFVCSATVVLKGVHIFGIGLVPFFFLTFVYLISFTPGRFPSTYNECFGISGPSSSSSLQAVKPMHKAIITHDSQNLSSNFFILSF